MYIIVIIANTTPAHTTKDFEKPGGPGVYALWMHSAAMPQNQPGPGTHCSGAGFSHFSVKCNDWSMGGHALSMTN